MTEFALAPYFHPTTVVFVDDNESFLRSLDLELPGGWACKTFTDPKIALEFVQRQPAIPPLMDRCFTMQRRSPSEVLIHLDLNLIEQEINHRERFSRISVVVVDYSMPRINGLDFCAALTDPLVRKAMLTGVADEKVAVEAFNAGLLNRFIPKHNNDGIGVILDFVDDLQQEYFSQYTARLKNALAIDPPKFLTEPVIANYVKTLMQREQLVEYYLVDTPPGLMLLKASGQIWRLVVMHEVDMQRQTEFARAHKAPKSILSAIEKRKKLGLFLGDSPDNYFGDEQFPWAEYVKSAQRLQGRNGQLWYVALWRDAPADIDFDPATSSYDAYLATL
jgi:CheY-like chemotaxis protein